MTTEIIALFILATCTRSNSIPTVSFDPFARPPDDIVIQKFSNVICPVEDSVNLSGLNLMRVPEKVVRSKTIQSISLNNNYIAYLPIDAFNETPNLNCLNLAGNELDLKLTGFQHDNLKTLILDDQSDKKGLELVDETMIPNQPVRFQNLETLSWKGIPYDFSLQFLTIAPKLRNLYVSESELKSIRLNIGMVMPYLKTLHLERNYITDIRDVDFGNVEALYLDENKNLNDISIHPAHAQNLKILSLSNCSFKELPNVEIASLKVLDLSYNLIQLIELKMPMFETVALLEVLDLSHNKLRTLPYLDNMIHLEKLSLNYNWIENVSERFAPNSLVTLNLRGNGIARIDSVAFRNLVVLTNLDLSENKLQYLPSDWNAKLRSLSNLNLKSNRFLQLENTGVHKLSNLKRLYVNGNLFNYIDSFTLANYVPPNCTVYVA